MRDATPMLEDEWICRRNITRFREMLEAACDDGQRLTLRELIAEQEAKLSGLTAPPIPRRA